MPQDASAALSSLLRSSTIDDHEEVLKAANAAIKANKDDVLSQQTRVVALLKLDRFDDALRAIADGGLKLEVACTLDKAYALYKTGNLDEATAVLRSSGADKRSFQHMAAQVAYRAERFDEARNIYIRLLEGGAAGEENDLTINLKATDAQAEWQGTSPPGSDPEQNNDSFELCYNAACAFIARGSLDIATNLLQRASRLCDASEDLSEDDKQAEMRPILAQQAYVYARQGKVKEALDLHKSLGASGDGETDVKLATENNRLALDTEAENPYLLHRKVASLWALEKDAKFFKYQADQLARNKLVLDLNAHKVAGVKSRTAKVLAQAQYPSVRPEINTASVLNAAASTQAASGNELIRRLGTLSAKRPDDVGLALTIIQIHLQLQHGAAALALLENFLARLELTVGVEAKDARYSPGIVALAVTLMRAQGRQSAAKNELVKSAAYWRGRLAAGASSLLREAGIELSRSSNDEDLALAGSAFQKLFDENRGSSIASAGLVASLAPTHRAQLQQHIANLPPIEDLIQGVDVSSLAAAGVAVSPKSGGTTSASGKRRAADDAGDRTSTKRRKRKLPKSYEEGKKPDPERWLPLRDRSSYRPKGKKGKKKAAESTQGGMVKEQETLELVGGGGVRVEKAPAAAGGGNKKKKKGKK